MVETALEKMVILLKICTNVRHMINPSTVHILEDAICKKIVKAKQYVCHFA